MELGGGGSVFLDDNISEMVQEFLKKAVQVRKTGKNLLKRCISQKNRERVYNDKFSKVNSLRKGKSEPRVR